MVGDLTKHGIAPAPEKGARSGALVPDFVRVAIAAALPLLAFAAQSVLWPWVGPFAWFLFYPAVFAAAWIGGLAGGLVATGIALPIAWVAFIPPAGAVAKEPRYLLSAAVFAGMGVLFAVLHGRIRRAEGALRRANDELSHNERQLRVANERLSELDRLKSQLFASVSHELRTPLALVLAPAERMLSRPDLPADDRANLETVTRNARLLRGHVEDLLDLATLEAGRMRLRRARVDVAMLVRQVAGSFEALASERSLSLQVDADGALAAEVDPEKLQRVLLNLLSNATKFTPGGGTVRVSLRGEDGRAVLEVADSGPGIPAEQRAAVFDRFHQLEGGAARRFGGMGLGLSITREIVALHGGSIAVGDAPEGGASFVVSLPLVASPGTEVFEEAVPLPVAPAHVAPAARSTPTPAGPAGSALVLVVEDNPDLNRFLREVLAERWRVASALDGAEGIRLATELRPDLVLTDLMMPGTSGGDLVRALRGRSEMDDTPIVVLTAKADEAVREELLRGGAQDWVGKPFVTGELLARVENLLEAKRARETIARREAILRAVFEGASVGIAHLGADGHFVTFNDRFRTMLGYPREELLAKRLAEVTFPDDRADDAEALNRANRGELRRHASEKRFVRADGAVVWARVDVGFLREGDRLVGGVAVVEDIGDRKRAEEEVRRLEQVRERVAVESAGMAVWNLDLTSGEMTWSETAFRMMGYEPTPDGLASPLMWAARVHPEDLPRVIEAMARARRERALFAETHRMLVEGRVRWARSFGRFLYEPDGTPTRFVGMAFEDTERQEAETRRKEAEERLGLLVDAVREYALFTLDPEGRVTKWNEGAARIYGYAAQEAIGMSRASFYPPDRIADAPDDLEVAARTGSVALEGWRRRKDGSLFWADVVVTARHDLAGRVTGFLTVTRDQTQRRAAEERFRLALEAAPSGMVMVDAQGEIVLVNRETERLFGYERGEILGRPVEILVPAHLREAHRAHRQAFQQAPSARRMNGNGELWGVRKDESAFPVEVGLTPVAGEGEPFVVASVLDITERRRTELEVRAARKALEERVADLEAFGYVLVHDLRAPLRAVQGYARLVEDTLGDRADEASRRMLGRMRDATVRMDHLIRDVLAYSQVAREASPKGTVDLDAVVEHVRANYTEVAAAEVDVRTPLGRVVGREPLVVQILSNLLGNAVKFVPAGRRPKVEVWTERRDGGLLRTCVRDNGIGVPPEHRERIFQPFERLHAGPEWPGTGIGLAIVQKAVGRMGGRVGVESDGATGSLFWFDLPEVAREH
ncbi:MAG: PAS domain S-box protein [Myxococcota bacterium]